MGDTENKTDKKQTPKRTQMSGLAALRKNLGVTPEEEVKEDVKLDVVEKEQPKEEASHIVAVEQPEKEIKDNVPQEREIISEQIPVVPIEPKIKEVPTTKVKPAFDGAKQPFENFLKRTDVNAKKETVNISTKNKECIKLMANLEKSTINSVIENIIDWFFESYNEDILKIPGMKDILKKYRK